MTKWRVAAMWRRPTSDRYYIENRKLWNAVGINRSTVCVCVRQGGPRDRNRKLMPLTKPCLAQTQPDDAFTNWGHGTWQRQQQFGLVSHTTFGRWCQIVYTKAQVHVENGHATFGCGRRNKKEVVGAEWADLCVSKFQLCQSRFEKEGDDHCAPVWLLFLGF